MRPRAPVEPSSGPRIRTQGHPNLDTQAWPERLCGSQWPAHHLRDTCPGSLGSSASPQCWVVRVAGHDPGPATSSTSGREGCARARGLEHRQSAMASRRPPPPAASATGQGFGCSGTGVGARCPWGINHGQAMLGQPATDASSARGGGPHVKGRPVPTGTPQPCKGCSSTARTQTVHVRNLCKVVTNNPIPLKQPRDTAGSGMPLGEASPRTANPCLPLGW